MDGEFKQAIEYDRRQLALLRELPPAQFIPGIALTPEQRYIDWLATQGIDVLGVGGRS